MHQDYIPFKSTGFFSSLINDYLDEVPDLKPFYNRAPKIENFEAQIQDKLDSALPSEHQRQILVSTLKDQYKDIETSELTLQHIERLKAENTFTITTGHQLNLFTGPLYFLYKIVSAINLAKALKAKYANYNFVPVYWMATEDHDFEEINYFNFKGKKFQWHRAFGGAVGELSTEGLNEVLHLFAQDLGTGNNATVLKQLFEEAYLQHDNLADATRFLANTLFKAQGLVIIDANTANLKRVFKPHMEKELFEQTAYNFVNATNANLTKVSKNYKIQVNPRPINLFYIKEGLRERIVLEDGVYKVVHTTIAWSKTEIAEELERYPERFSPNVIMRPLYQEVILPNLCYIGGGGELAYWLQLKAYFEAMHVVFPVLLLRNSALIQAKKQAEKLKRLQISNTDLFLKRDHFINKKVRDISNIDINFSAQKQYLETQFQEIYALAKQTDASFLGAVKAQEVKQKQGLVHLEKRLLKAQKQKLKDEVERMVTLQNELFPNGNLQERNANFSTFYLEYGTALIPNLLKSLNPLREAFSILEL